jgi:hypothetical protein
MTFVSKNWTNESNMYYDSLINLIKLIDVNTKLNEDFEPCPYQIQTSMSV